jgi:hypothetical protein
VERVLTPEFGDDWLDFEVVLNESTRLSDDDHWLPDLDDRQERVEAAFEHAFERILGSPDNNPRLRNVYHRFRNHLLRMWGAFQEAQAQHEKAEREAAERFWSDLRLVRAARTANAEQWMILNGDGDRMGDVSVVWSDPPSCLIVLDERLSGDRGNWHQVVWRLEQEILLEDPGVMTYAVWQKSFVGEFYRCADCGELHNQFDEDPSDDLRLDLDDD